MAKKTNEIRLKLAPLESLKDHHPKYLLTMDFAPYTSYNGIKQMNGIRLVIR